MADLLIIEGGIRYKNMGNRIYITMEILLDFVVIDIESPQFVDEISATLSIRNRLEILSKTEIDDVVA